MLTQVPGKLSEREVAEAGSTSHTSRSSDAYSKGHGRADGTLCVRFFGKQELFSSGDNQKRRSWDLGGGKETVDVRCFHMQP